MDIAQSKHAALSTHNSKYGIGSWSAQTMLLAIVVVRGVNVLM